MANASLTVKPMWPTNPGMITFHCPPFIPISVSFTILVILFWFQLRWRVNCFTFGSVCGYYRDKKANYHPNAVNKDSKFRSKVMKVQEWGSSTLSSCVVSGYQQSEKRNPCGQVVSSPRHCGLVQDKIGESMWNAECT